jgi:hypothetical protein
MRESDLTARTSGQQRTIGFTAQWHHNRLLGVVIFVFADTSPHGSGYILPTIGLAIIGTALLAHLVREPGRANHSKRRPASSAAAKPRRWHSGPPGGVERDGRASLAAD